MKNILYKSTKSWWFREGTSTPQDTRNVWWERKEPLNVPERAFDQERINEAAAKRGAACTRAWAQSAGREPQEEQVSSQDKQIWTKEAAINKAQGKDEIKKIKRKKERN